MVLQSKSGVEESRRLMAGHLPAVKAGGKRVKVKKSSEDPRVTPEKGAKRTEKPRSLPSFKGPHHVGLLLSGTLGKVGHRRPQPP
ncbi:hypothetical protein NHX12_006757 [Muraenolepis orangiensis]|uniref:Uncharacterized protein n=1 Tax=Muraenolepis orangiensis TaxID=630683 RepID=A0A9Q0IAY0_9TELE|nr:hypothetical protein NHX12_006757 [Muraenolepis orangiensis]